jgi:hypothetical protein
MVSIGLANSSLQVAFMSTEDCLFTPDRNSFTAVYHTHGDMRVSMAEVRPVPQNACGRLASKSYSRASA